jgi:molybdenum cofactor cytidylyltransferase
VERGPPAGRDAGEMPNVAAVVLAAGGSSRLGQPKQLLTFRGETLVRRAVRAAAEAECAPIVVVVGETREAIERSLDIRDSRISSSFGQERVGLASAKASARASAKASASPSASPSTVGAAVDRKLTVVENEEWQRGIGTSIRRGLERLPKDVEAAVLLTCDQPFLDAAIVRQLIAAHEETDKPIIASSYANTLGVPALFDRSCFDALLALPDATGAKAFILSRRNDVTSVPFARGEIDIDTPGDLERLTRL